ncbi:hypothetical protein PUN28_012639 [Cardiocondyla obscurior]|uniref:Uncharacterized protein n=1 Tax=Cardiocondyla obscurior TaxID=286306 RepID=A0AAW2FF67_9HYME
MHAARHLASSVPAEREREREKEKRIPPALVYRQFRGSIVRDIAKKIPERVTSGDKDAFMRRARGKASPR